MSGDTSVRVLHIDTEHGWRGGERQALWLATSLAHGGHESLIAARPDQPLAARARAAGLEVIATTPWLEFAPLEALRLRRLITRRRIDIVHAHTGHAVALGALATLGTDAAMVVTRRVDFTLRNNVATRVKYGRAAAIIAISRAVADALVRSGIPRDRIDIVHSGIDLTRHVTPASEDRLRALGVRSRPLVVQVGALVGHKDPVNFVRAIAVARDSCPTLQALMLGDGPLRADVEAARETLGLHGVLHIPGHVSDADAILATADVATLSSREEGLGTVLLDAMAFGRPIAAASGGGISEVISDGVTGLLAPPRDPTALGHAIATLLSDRDLATRLARAGRARVESEFSVARTAQRTLEIYQRVRRDAERTVRR